MPQTDRGRPAATLESVDELMDQKTRKDAAAELQTDATEILKGELKTLCRHYSHYFAGFCGSLLLGFLSFPVFTRIFSVSDYGTLDFIQKIVTLLIAVAKLGFQHAVVRFYDHHKFTGDETAARTYYSTMFFGGLSTALTVTIIFVAIVRMLPNSVLSEQLKNCLCFASALIVLGAVESIQWGFLRIQERTKTYNVAMISMKACTLVFIYLLLWLGQRSVYVFFAGAIGAESLVVTVLIARLIRSGWITPRGVDLSLFYAAASFGAPLILYELANTILDSGDRFLVRRYLGVEVLGYYSVASNIAGYCYQLVLVPLNLALVPMYMKLWSARGPEKTAQFLSRGLDMFLLLAVALMCTIVVTAQDVVVVLASEKYRSSAGLVPIIAAGLLIYATLAFVAAGLLIYKKTVVMVIQVLCAAGANFGLNCLLLPMLGTKGAAVATLMGYALCIFLLSRSSFRILPLSVEVGRMGCYLSSGIVGAMAAARIDLGQALLNVIIKALVSLAIYFGMLTVMDRRLRGQAADLLQSIRAKVIARQSGADRQKEFSVKRDDI